MGCKCSEDEGREMMRKILIVDDNPDDIEITKVALEEKGWDVEVEVTRARRRRLSTASGRQRPCQLGFFSTSISPV